MEIAGLQHSRIQTNFCARGLRRETWCPVEYAQHTTFAIGGIEWAAREFVDGRSPDWTQEPNGLAGQFEHDKQARTAQYAEGLIIDTAAVVRHALHDAEHHLLDIRRGIARLQLAASAG